MTVSSSSEWGLVGGTARIQAARFACGGEQRIAVTQLLEGEGVGFVVDKVEMPAVHVINHASRWMTVSAVGTSKGSRLRAPAAAGCQSVRPLLTGAWPWTADSGQASKKMAPGHAARLA